MISTSSIRNSSKDYHSCGQPYFASINQFFIIPICQIVQIVNSQPTVLEACQHSNYAGKIFQFQSGTHESPKLVKPQKKHLESMFRGTSTKSGVVQNLLASHANGKTSPIHSSTTCAQWLHLMSLPQKWNHQLVLLQSSH